MLDASYVKSGFVESIFCVFVKLIVARMVEIFITKIQL